MPDLYTLTPQQKLDAIRSMYHNPELFAKTCYPHIVYDKPAKFHNLFWEAIYLQRRRQAVIVPRGSAKTSIMGTIGTAYDIAFDRETFIVMIKKTYDQAFWDLDNIKSAILWNDAFHFFFFKPIVERNSKDTLIVVNPITRHRTTIISLGSEQEVRGRLSRNQRISKLVFDDVESEKNTDTQFQREKLKRHIYSNAMPGLDPEKGKVLAVGTIVHYDSWLNSILEAWRKGDTSWHVIFAQARDAEGKPTWPDRFSDERLKEIEEEYKQRGMHSAYFMEYMNIPISDEERDFPPELVNSHFHDKRVEIDKYAGSVLVEGDNVETCNLFLGVDPSTGAGRDWSGFTVVAKTHDNVDYVIESYKKKLPQFELMQEIWDINARYNFQIKLNIVEEQAAFKWLYEAYKIICRKNNRWLPWKGVSARMGTGPSEESRGKQRIRMLSYKFTADALYIKKNHIDLIEELLTFPKGRSDDIADSLAYATDPNCTYPPGKIETVLRRVTRKVVRRYDWRTGASYDKYRSYHERKYSEAYRSS